MFTRRRVVPALLALVVAVLVPLTGCANAAGAEPEDKTFKFTGKSLNVKSHGIPTDLVPADRKDVKVTRWFDKDGRIGDTHEVWELQGDVLELRAGCNGLANCDAKFRVEVPQGVAVLRDGRETDLKG
ncbi:lipoprotein [Streptomyces rubellomurinus subsp. indigoferus]|uniref:Lipoprotein n=1 Tax=Streptomyces rubellomurinus (strain ATCC 31215) TaxID=359131 RepID=A0A0F2TDJ1_STRR3|nr:hypothetical protein [Streptomyces rubellomurinus]KJS56963.1 lipoprotein [Streptomyces rubellomurinus subsp. indigoferus]KJS61234.1 lipoprotein [Streptomyces rubellomurinus]